MKIYGTSVFKDPVEGSLFLNNWKEELEQISKTKYKKTDILTPLGKTVVWEVNTGKVALEPLVIFPGYRTSALFWDLDGLLDPLKENYRIYLVEINGQPNLSEGNSPTLKNNDYGLWASDVLDKLHLEKAYVAGASFGGLILAKLCLVAPQKVKKAIYLNPAFLQNFSLSFKNVYYNLLPLIRPTRRNINKFMDHIVFFGDHNRLSEVSEDLLRSYIIFVIKNFRDKAQKPFAMKEEEIRKIGVKSYLLLGENDLLFPAQKSKERATKWLPDLRDVHVLENTGHGIETSRKAIQRISKWLD